MEQKMNCLANSEAEGELLRHYYQENFLKFKVGLKDTILPQIVVYDNSELRLKPDAVQFVPDQCYSQYLVPGPLALMLDELLEWQKANLGNSVFNARTIRLNRIEMQKNALTLLISQATYYDYIATNFSMDIKRSECEKSLRDIVHPQGQLCKLEESLLANHIGLASLVFTKDNFLILAIRSKKGVNFRQQLVSPSISGAADFDQDFLDGVRSREVSTPVSTLIREGCEELGVDISSFDTSSIIFLGITRELLRGGKPELFFSARLNLRASELVERFQRAQDKQENLKLELFKFRTSLAEPTSESDRQSRYKSMLREAQQLLEHYQSRLSLPVLTNLLLYIKYRFS